MIGWTSVLFATQSWLSETPSQRSTSGTPAYFSVGMAVLAVGVVSGPLPSHFLDELRELMEFSGVYAAVSASTGQSTWAGDWDGGAGCCSVLGAEGGEESTGRRCCWIKLKRVIRTGSHERERAACTCFHLTGAALAMVAGSC